MKNPSYDNGNHEESTDLSEIGLTSGLFKLEFSASTKGVAILSLIMVCF